MACVGDILHISFTVSPEWYPAQYLDPFYIKVETMMSCQVGQTEGWATIVNRMKEIVQYELAPTHIMRYHQKLNEISPNTDYSVDSATANSMVKQVQLDTVTSGDVQAGMAHVHVDLNHLPPSFSDSANYMQPPLRAQAPAIQTPGSGGPLLLAWYARPNPPVQHLVTGRCVYTSKGQ